METIDHATGEVSQGTPAPASDEVPAAVSAKFDAIFGSGSGPANADGTQDERDELEQEGVLTPDGNDPADEAAATDQGELSQDDTATDEGRDSGEALKGQANSGKGDKAPLDPFLRFVGQHSGLTDEQIDKAYAADPTFATATLTTLGQQYTDLSRQYVTPGSPVAPGTQGGEQQPAQPPQPTPAWDGFMSQLAAFSEANGEDMGKMVKLLNDEFVGPLKSLMAANAAREQDLARQEAAAGFETVRKSFGDFYGPENGQLSPVQLAARQQVGMIADQIRAGAKAQGKTVSIGEAISRAHAIVTHDMRQQAARRDLVAQVAKRSKAATVPPTQRKSRPTGERSDKAAEDAARQKMMEMGLDNF